MSGTSQETRAWLGAKRKQAAIANTMKMYSMFGQNKMVEAAVSCGHFHQCSIFRFGSPISFIFIVMDGKINGRLSSTKVLWPVFELQILGIFTRNVGYKVTGEKNAYSVEKTRACARKIK